MSLTETLEELEKTLKMPNAHAQLLSRTEGCKNGMDHLRSSAAIYRARKILGFSLEPNERGLVEGNLKEKLSWDLALNLAFKEQSHARSLSDGVVAGVDNGD